MSEEDPIQAARKTMEALSAASKEIQEWMKQISEPSRRLMEQWKLMEEAAVSFHEGMSDMARMYTQVRKISEAAQNAVRWMTELKPYVVPIMSIAEIAKGFRGFYQSFLDMQTALEAPEVDWKEVDTLSAEVNRKLLAYVSMLEKALDRERRERERLEQVIKDFNESKQERPEFYE